ncbi:hypothetical protein NUW58_g1941 [Xylaria curta]|uniref:Uncharacterized protein n=1 Tax=Xylaria curta TaxID=42375 RepID=A0ACC1PHZ0_9PEZI|nr:hypothetical protein NUW58_g1941 [Xylaria curta]
MDTLPEESTATKHISAESPESESTSTIPSDTRTGEDSPRTKVGKVSDDMMDPATSLSENRCELDKESRERRVLTDIEEPPEAEHQPATETESKIQQFTRANEPTEAGKSALKEEDTEFLGMYRTLLSVIYPEGISQSTVDEVHKYILHQGGRSFHRPDHTRKLSLLLQAYLRSIDNRFAGPKFVSDYHSQDYQLHRTRKMMEIQQQRIMTQQEAMAREAMLKPVGTKTTKDKVPKDPPKSKLTIPTLNRVMWPDFKRHYEELRDVSTEHAIDVLIGEPVIPHIVWREQLLRSVPRHLEDLGLLYQSLSSSSFADRKEPATVWGQEGSEIQKKTFLPSNDSSTISKDSYTPMPDRIRINGEPLLLLLREAIGIGDSFKDPCVVLKPFKLLVHNERHIRNLYSQLQEKFENKSAPLSGHQDDTDDSGSFKGTSVHGEKSGDLLVRLSTEQAYKELGCLIKFMDEDLKVLKHLDDGSMSEIYFSDLWHVFKPGEEVIISQKPHQAYRVLQATGGRPYLCPPIDENEENDTTWNTLYRIPEKSSRFVVSCYHVGFDGIRFGPVTQLFDIQEYDGLRDITSLPIYPLRFAKDSDIVRKTLLENGHTFLKVLRGGHRQYSGPNLHEAEEIDSRILVDFHAALWDGQDKNKSWDFKVDFGLRPPPSANKAEVRMVSAGGCERNGCCENDNVFDDLDLDSKSIKDSIGDKPILTKDIRYLTDDPSQIPQEDMILLPRKVPAFILKDRKWAVIDINYVKEVEKLDGWRSLVLPAGHQDMVQALVQAHYRSKIRPDANEDVQVDLVRGKGKGLIVLLHGAPGVGKTSTAECVADFCDRPLYPITCGDLGITAEEVEARLKRIFIQAQKWNCVLLLDEADVFLSERENNVKHNSLVSVFLRVLEYYQGILFLTTNRVGRIDEAFKSRVHMSLYYPPLNRTSMREIFMMNIERTKLRKQGTMRVKDKEIMEFASDHYQHNKPSIRWNGRQIRNAFHVAIALAENEAQEQEQDRAKKNSGKEVQAVLRAEHFDSVERASSKFDDYLHDVLGMGHSDRVHQQALRFDNWRGRQNNHDERNPKDADRRRRRRRSDSSSSELYIEDERRDDSKRRHQQSGQHSSNRASNRNKGRSPTDITDEERHERREKERQRGNEKENSRRRRDEDSESEDRGPRSTRARENQSPTGKGRRQWSRYDSGDE